MNIRMLRQFIPPAVLCAGLGLVSLPVAGQSGAGADGPQQVADELADELVSGMREHPELHRQRVALQPLEPKDFVALNNRERRRLHELLVASLRSEIRGSYELVDPGRFTDIARILETRGESDWFARYQELFREAGAQLNITCRAGPSSGGRFEVRCTAFTMETNKNRGAGRGEFTKDWLTRPVSLDWALASIAEQMVAYVQGVGGLGEVTSVDSELGSGTELTDEVAKLLRVWFDEKQRSWLGWRAVDGERGEAGHRAVVEVRRYEESLRLHVELSSVTRGRTTFSETVEWTPELRELAGVAGGRRVGGDECEAGADPGERVVQDEFGRPITLADWVFLAGERLRTANFKETAELLVQAKVHLADHCEWDEVSGIMAAAISGLVQELRAEIERGARSGLERLRRVEASAGKHLELLDLRARAHELLGERREEDRAYLEWLKLAPRTEEYRARRLAVLKAQARIRAEIAAEDGEIALGLDGPKRSLVRRGLASFGYDGGEGPAEFDASFRVALRSWQAKNDRKETGYLTADQAQALMAEGRAAEEREEDDEAFVRAKAANTAAEYAAYLARYPDGVHAAEAKRRLDVARARDDEARARAAAEAGERALVLEAGDKVLVERGLASWKAGGGAVDGRFNESFRALLRSWQASEGHLDTGYLTAEQARALIEDGRAAGEREQDDAAFARAKAADAEAAYLAYLSEYPQGVHAAEARRRLEAVRAREDDAAFTRAKKADTEAAYAAYLAQYPEGRHVSEARRLREAAREEEEPRKDEAPADADTVLNDRDVFNLLNAAVSHYYKKNVERFMVESACYFDPQVENSMSCPWRAGGGGADPHWLRQRVKQDGTKWCKENGGESCTLLWRNGKLRSDALSPEESQKLESIMRNLPEYDLEAVPLPEGVEVSTRLPGRFGEFRDYWEERRKKLKGRKVNYALCASDAGPWSTASQTGGQTAAEGLKAVRAMCMLKCQAGVEWFDRDGSCYLVFENGKFASGAARNAVMQ